MAKGGRKSKLTAESRKTFLDSIRAGATRKSACARAGFSEDALSRYLLRFADFAEDLSRAEADVEVAHAAVIKKAAMGYDAGTTKTVTRTVVKMRKITEPDGRVIEEPVTVQLVTTEKLEVKEFDWRAAAFALERRFGWTKRNEITGVDGGPIQVETLPLKDLTQDELDRRIAQAEGRKAPKALPSGSG